MTLHKHVCDGREAEIRKLMVAGQTSYQVADALGVSRKALLHFVASRSLGRWQRLCRSGAGIEVPKDFAARWATMTYEQMANHYGCSITTVQRWASDAGMRRDKSEIQRGRTPMPADFRQHANTTVAAICERYGCGRALALRWRSEAGIGRSQPFHLVNARTPANPASVSRVQRDMSRVGQAADWLRKYSGVWRCTPTGSPKADGTHWRRGSAILTDAEIIERAERLGWDADAWKRVA